ncbi:MAG: S-adenosylmethionine:tRNA ribosyltransferase-isomerase [Prevotellaceae bacterium]|nr:S-adenosylmethionine:tRNA ribosyltransferase-isomerase [Prevotellaceae bacterium]
MDTKHIQINDFDYPLPDERIAKFPLEQRDHSKLLLYDKGKISEDKFFNLHQYIPSGTLMVMNNTKVIQARIHFRKSTGALIEVFLLEPSMPTDYEQVFQTRGHCQWVCLIGNLKKWKGGALTCTFALPDSQSACTLTAELCGQKGTGYLVDFTWTCDNEGDDDDDYDNDNDDENLSFAELIDVVGELPIPPYLNRETQESDKRTYQTVYSKIKGSVAAPTAGLHFTPEVLQSLDAKGVEREELTLHVGAGTFKPVKSAKIADHEMHSETFCVAKHTIEALLDHNCEVLAVGTTSVRTLESLYYLGCMVSADPDISEYDLHVTQWQPYDNAERLSAVEAITALQTYMEAKNLTAIHGSTQIIIAPGYEYKIVKKLITNFHQPKSTLLLLVSAFLAGGDWHEIYDYALAHDFRFLSYGDSSLIVP